MNTIQKEESLEYRFPELAKQWDYEKNEGITPSDVSCGSHIRVWWIGSCGHSWNAQIKSRVQGCDCPFCAGHSVLKGFNDLKTRYPDVANEWDYEKNSGLCPDEILPGSHKKVWWIGSCGHSWNSEIKSRVQGRGCPFCTGRSLLKGFNDLKTRYPDVAREWNYKKNVDLFPEDILPGSHERVWWICSQGHEWQISPNKRTSRNRGCPYCCHNPKALSGENDLETLYPEIAEEWHPTKNGELSPNMVTANSNKPVWWMCKKGHSWRTSPNHRVDGSGCPKCASGRQTSFPEQAVFFYISKAFPDAINKYTDIFEKTSMEIDIYIPSLQFGIEYDGSAYHKESLRRREIEKYSICEKYGIKLLRIRENHSDDRTDNCDYLLFTSNNLSQTIEALKKYLPNLGEIDVDRDKKDILANYLTSQKEKSLESVNPSLCHEWNYKKNGNLSPDMFLPNSNEIVWWKCDKSHEWQASIYARNTGAGCPFCSNNKVQAGFNDLATKRPDLLKEWHQELNTEIKPHEITPGSGKKVWWKCSVCGYEWCAEISSRNKGSGCPKCARRPKNK